MLRKLVPTSLVSLTIAAGLYGAVAVQFASAEGQGAPQGGSTQEPGSSQGMQGGSTQELGSSQGMPTQESADLPASDPRSAGPGWADVPGGVAARPYVVSMTVINGGVPTPVITNGTTAPAPVAVGGLSTVISAENLCRPGQTPAQGSCYATPNRVALTVGYGNTNSLGWDFSKPNVTVSPTIDANTVIDMTVALNSVGRSLRWTWINGDLLYWQTSNLGQANATVHLKFRPASAPNVLHYPANNFCSASPPRECHIERADGEVLAANLVFSLDETLDPALTGAAFATQNAIIGYMSPGGTPQAPSLDVQAMSTHLKSDGSPQLGTIQAFIPSAALLRLWGMLPSDSMTALSTTRLGDPGTNEPPTYTPWSAGVNGSDGLLITVKGVTFSIPNYHVADRLKPVALRAMTRGSTTTITASIAACRGRSRCLADVYNLGPRRATRSSAQPVLVIANRVVAGRSLAVSAPASKLKRGNIYRLVVRSAKGRRLLVSSVGVVH